MKIKNWFQFLESISGWELVGQHMGPAYPEQKLPVTLSPSSTEVLMDKDGNFYVYDDYQSLYQDYLKKGGKPLEGFNNNNLQIVLDLINQSI